MRGECVDDESMTRGGWGMRSTDALHLCLPQNPAALLQSEDLALLLEHLACALEDHLEAFLAGLRVLLEAVDGELLDAVLDLLPSSAEGCDLGALCEVGLIGWCGGVWCVDTGLADLEQVCPCNVHRCHGELLGDGINVGCLVDHGRVDTTEDGGYPLRCGLLTCNEAFCAQLSY